MEKQLINYISDTTNPEFNYELGLVYKNLGHTSSAVSYLLRAAERSEDLNLSYECLLFIADCFIQQKNRDFTVKGLYLHAITVLPKRPEAYYLLSKLYETRSEYSECYTISEIGLNISDFDLPPLRTYFGHNGKYGLMFQKAFASWWWGKGTESRKLFRELAFKHWGELDENLKGAVKNNLMRLENKKFIYPKDFEWADLTEEDIVTIDREIVNENVYRFWEDVKEGDIVLDIGSSVGAYTISILDQKPKKVYCVEPSKNLLETSIRNCSKKLSNSPHTEIIYINNGIVQNNNDYINVFGHDKNFTPITFKELIEKYSISFINYMKIDCEGGEYSIFNDDNIEFILNNVEFISMEIHLKGKNFRKKFKNFRDKYLSKFKNYKVMSCTRQNISWGKSIDITHMIFDDNFINEYNCEFMIYINNKKYDR